MFIAINAFSIGARGYFDLKFATTPRMPGVSFTSRPRVTPVCKGFYVGPDRGGVATSTIPSPVNRPAGGLK